MAARDESPEIGRDALDPARPPALWAQFFPARRAALGLAATPAPSLTFIALGVLLGPDVLGLLTPRLLTTLDPVVSVALAALGIFVGLGVGATRVPRLAAIAAAALLEVILTILVVGGAMYLLLTRWAVPLSIPVGLFAITAGICSSASAAMRASGEDRAARVARIADLDDVPLVVLGSAAVALAASQPVLFVLAATAAASLLAGAAGLLLFERAHGDAERGVFVAGAVALLGGAGAYAGTSPLLSGAVAAVIWVWSPGRADRIIETDLRKLHHPLVALLLIVAGASIRWDYTLLWIAAPLVLLRLSGKLLASIGVSRIADVPSGLLATVLAPPGVLGVAVALNLQQVLGPSGTLLLSGITVAMGVSELLSAFLLPGSLEDPA